MKISGMESRDSLFFGGTMNILQAYYSDQLILEIGSF